MAELGYTSIDTPHFSIELSKSVPFVIDYFMRCLKNRIFAYQPERGFRSVTIKRFKRRVESVMFAEVNEAGVPGRPECVSGMGPGGVFTLDKNDFVFQCLLGDAGGKPAGRRPIPDARFVPEYLSQPTTNIHREAS